MATNGNLNEKKTHRICLKLSSRSSGVPDYFVLCFSLRHCRECFYRIVEILEIPNKWLVVLYHFRRQLEPHRLHLRSMNCAAVEFPLGENSPFRISVDANLINLINLINEKEFYSRNFYYLFNRTANECK